MLKNVPNRLSQRMLLETLQATPGVAGRFDFLYLPIDFRNSGGGRGGGGSKDAGSFPPPPAPPSPSSASSTSTLFSASSSTSTPSAAAAPPVVRCNLGYAFVNCVDARAAAALVAALHGRAWGAFRSRKVCEVRRERVFFFFVVDLFRFFFLTLTPFKTPK